MKEYEALKLKYMRAYRPGSTKPIPIPKRPKNRCWHDWTPKKEDFGETAAASDAMDDLLKDFERL